MISLLVWLTTLVNVGGLAVSLCLGLYLVTRPPRSRLSWLAALTLWSLCGFYLNNALLIYVPGSDVLPWLRAAQLLAIALAFHLLLLLPANKEPQWRAFLLPAVRLPWQGSRFSTIGRAGVPLAYGLALILFAMGVFPLGLPPQFSPRPVVSLSYRMATPLYPLVPGYLLLLVMLSVLHLWQCRKEEPSPKGRRQYIPLFSAVVLTGLSGLYLGLGVELHLQIPSFPADLALGATAAILGYRVAQTQARIQGVAIGRDLLYIGLGIGSLTICYVLLAEILHLGGHMFSTVTLIMIVVVAVSSLMLYDALRSSLDRLFYREHFRQLRANLRSLSRESGIGQGLPERLQAVLKRLCATLGVRQGLVAMRDGELFICQASERAQPVGEAFPEGALACGEIAALPLPGAAGLEGMSLLIPIHADGGQVAALALGGKESGAPFIEEDLILLDDLADDLGRMIHTMRLQEENARVLRMPAFSARWWPTLANRSTLCRDRCRGCCPKARPRRAIGRNRSSCRRWKMPCDGSTIIPTWGSTRWPGSESYSRAWKAEGRNLRHTSTAAKPSARSWFRPCASFVPKGRNPSGWQCHPASGTCSSSCTQPT